MNIERQQMSLIRPGTLVQVLQLVGSSEKLRFCLAGFLDEFYRDASTESRARRIAEDPRLAEEPKLNALLGAIGEHLAIRWDLGYPAGIGEPT
jgi:hypothetical protein